MSEPGIYSPGIAHFMVLGAPQEHGLFGTVGAILSFNRAEWSLGMVAFGDRKE